MSKFGCAVADWGKRLLKGIKKELKANLLAGLLFLTPVAATFYFLKFSIQWLDRILLIIPDPYRPENLLPFAVPGIGVIVLIIVLFVTGLLVRNYLGRQLVGFWDKIISRIPVVSKFYVSVKQLIETVFHGTGKDFKRVVLVEFPRSGAYSIAYVTGVAMGEIQDKTEKRMLNLYVPTTPNPTSGYYLIVPEDEVVPLDMGVEDSFKLLISGGIINPESKQAGGYDDRHK
ncbi:MAG: DUF502 domain-containing protein [Thermodesulfobacteriota bacterium]